MLIVDTEFDNLNSCGALIRNRRYNNYQKTVTYTNYATVYSGRSNNYAKQVYSVLNTYPGGYNPFTTLCSKTDGATNPCFSINMVSSIFSNFGFMKAFKTFPTWVNPTLGL